MESTAPPLETSGGANWRSEAGDRLRRVHSLLFGTELALERGEAATARTFSLRLLGFLDSQTGDESANRADSAFVKPIRTEAASKLATANRLLAPDSDRCFL
jgi:fidgetin-like protein 1